MIERVKMPQAETPGGQNLTAQPVVILNPDGSAADGSGGSGAAGPTGLLTSATFTPTAAAYGAGDIMDVAKQLQFLDSSGDPVPEGSIIRILSAVMKIDVNAVPSGQTSYTLHLYSVTPPSAQADNAAWTLASADLDGYRGALALGAPVDLGACLYIRAQYLDIDVKLVTDSLWAELVTDGAHTAAAVARQIILYGIVH